MTKEVPLRLLLAVVAAGTLLFVAGHGGSAFAAANVQFKDIDCAPEGHEPGAFDIVRIHNLGDAAQDLAGWQLKSDPEDAQWMALDVAGTVVPELDPADRPLTIVAGQHAESYPDVKVYRWTIGGVLRDSGDPPDYVKLFDPSGNLIDSMDCNQQPLPVATTVPATATPAPQVAVNQPSTGTTDTTTANDQQNRAASSGQNPVGQSSTAPASAAAGSVSAPDSGIGSLAPVNATSWPLAFGALAAGLMGLAVSGMLLLRRGPRRR